MATHAQNGTIARQIEALEHAIEDTAKQGGQTALAVADRGRQILSLARELASDVAETTREEAASRAARVYRRVADTAQHDVEIARETVREHPLLSVAVVAAASALAAVVVTGAVHRNHHH